MSLPLGLQLWIELIRPQLLRENVEVQAILDLCGGVEYLQFWRIINPPLGMEIFQVEDEDFGATIKRIKEQLRAVFGIVPVDSIETPSAPPKEMTSFEQVQSLPKRRIRLKS